MLHRTPLCLAAAALLAALPASADIVDAQFDANRQSITFDVLVENTVVPAADLVAIVTCEAFGPDANGGRLSMGQASRAEQIATGGAVGFHMKVARFYPFVEVTSSECVLAWAVAP